MNIKNLVLIEGMSADQSEEWLLSGHYFYVMTGHYETFLGSFELRVKATSAWAKTKKKMVKRWYNSGADPGF